jgi:hypothetical protein
MVETVLDDEAARACFGFRIRSQCALDFARTGGGEQTLEVREAAESLAAPESTLMAEWVVRDAGHDVVTRLHRNGAMFHYWTNDAGWFRIDPCGPVIDISPEENAVRREQRLWGVPSVLCFMERGDFGLHAAAVEVDGRAILLAAPGRHGKTTLAVAFHERGYRLLTEDTSCCRIASDPVLLPGPTSVRLRPDMFSGTPPNGTRVVSVRPDRVNLVLDPEGANSSAPVPISGLVFLREPTEHMSLERLDAGAALRDLWALNFRLPDTRGRTRSFQQLAQLAGRISIWNLYRPLSRNMGKVIDTIVETCR